MIGVVPCEGHGGGCLRVGRRVRKVVCGCVDLVSVGVVLSELVCWMVDVGRLSWSFVWFGERTWKWKVILIFDSESVSM